MDYSIKTKESRNSSIELLRIIAGFMIISNHFINHGVLQPISDYIEKVYNTNLAFSQLASLFYCPENEIFIIITGYYLSYKKYQGEGAFKRIFILAIEQLFYSVLFVLINYSLHLGWIVSIKQLIGCLFPLFFGRNWFISCYIIFCVFIVPLLNILLKNLDKQKLFMLFLVCFSLHSFLPVFGIRTFVSDGNGILMFMEGYVLGAFLRRYEDEYQTVLFYKILVGSYFALAASMIAMITIGSRYHSNLILNNVTIFTTVFDVAIAASLFVIFKRKSFSNKYINIVAKSVLGIYLISENDLLWPHLWTEYFKCQDIVYSSLSYAFLKGMSLILIVFCGSFIIDLVRRFIFKFLTPKFLQIYDHIESCIFRVLKL